MPVLGVVVRTEIFTILFAILSVAVLVAGAAKVARPSREERRRS